MASDAVTTSSLRALDDLGLVRRIAEHRRDALAELYDRYAPLLAGIARRVLGDGSGAGDVVQETLLEVWSEAEKFDASRWSVSTWLVLIARGRALARHRARRAGVSGGEAAAPPPRADLAPAAVELQPRLARRRERVREALAGLGREERELLESAFWEGLSRSEIAARTGVPLDVVKQRALAAMKSIRQALRDQIRELV